MSNKTEYEDLYVISQREDSDDYTVIYIVKGLKYSPATNEVCYVLENEGVNKYISSGKVGANAEYMIMPKTMADIVVGGRLLIQRMNNPTAPNIDTSIVN